MRLAPAARQLLEEFFRAQYRDPHLRLPPVRVYRGIFAGLLTAVLGIGGITLGTSVIIAPRYAARRRSDGAQTVEGWLLVHEITHVLQYERDGWLKFLTGYLSEYLKALFKIKKLNRAARETAYLELSAEREARANEQSFMRWQDMKKYAAANVFAFAAERKKPGAGEFLPPDSVKHDLI